MAELFVKKHTDACQVIVLLDAAGLSGSMRCGCPDRTSVCARQQKGTVEHDEYKAESAKGNKDIFYACPNGTYFTVSDDRLEEAEAIYTKYLDDQKNWLIKIISKYTRKFFETLNPKWR